MPIPLAMTANRYQATVKFDAGFERRGDLGFHSIPDVAFDPDRVHWRRSSREAEPPSQPMTLRYFRRETGPAEPTAAGSALASSLKIPQGLVLSPPRFTRHAEIQGGIREYQFDATLQPDPRVRPQGDVLTIGADVAGVRVSNLPVSSEVELPVSVTPPRVFLVWDRPGTKSKRIIVQGREATPFSIRKIIAESGVVAVASGSGPSVNHQIDLSFVGPFDKSRQGEIVIKADPESFSIRIPWAVMVKREQG
jgi:hypothetical protein